MKMKYILLLMLGFHFHALAGDGTLPLIRNVQIDFLQDTAGLGIKLPNCLNVKINKKLRKGNPLTKKVKLKEANLLQTLKLENIGQDIKIGVESKSLNSGQMLPSLGKPLNPQELLNEINLGDGMILQKLEMNTGSLASHCKTI